MSPSASSAWPNFVRCSLPARPPSAARINSSPYRVSEPVSTLNVMLSPPYGLVPGRLSERVEHGGPDGGAGRAGCGQPPLHPSGTSNETGAHEPGPECREYAEKLAG